MSKIIKKFLLIILIKNNILSMEKKLTGIFSLSCYNDNEIKFTPACPSFVSLQKGPAKVHLNEDAKNSQELIKSITGKYCYHYSYTETSINGSSGALAMFIAVNYKEIENKLIFCSGGLNFTGEILKIDALLFKLLGFKKFTENIKNNYSEDKMNKLDYLLILPSKNEFIASIYLKALGLKEENVQYFNHTDELKNIKFKEVKDRDIQNLVKKKYLNHFDKYEETLDQIINIVLQSIFNYNIDQKYFGEKSINNLILEFFYLLFSTDDSTKQKLYFINFMEASILNNNLNYVLKILTSIITTDEFNEISLKDREITLKLIKEYLQIKFKDINDLINHTEVFKSFISLTLNIRSNLIDNINDESWAKIKEEFNQILIFIKNKHPEIQKSIEDQQKINNIFKKNRDLNYFPTTKLLIENLIEDCKSFKYLIEYPNNICNKNTQIINENNIFNQDYFINFKTDLINYNFNEQKKEMTNYLETFTKYIITKYKENELYKNMIENFRYEIREPINEEDLKLENLQNNNLLIKESIDPLNIYFENWLKELQNQNNFYIFFAYINECLERNIIELDNPYFKARWIHFIKNYFDNSNLNIEITLLFLHWSFYSYIKEKNEQTKKFYINIFCSIYNNNNNLTDLSLYEYFLAKSNDDFYKGSVFKILKKESNNTLKIFIINDIIKDLNTKKLDKNDLSYKLFYPIINLPTIEKIKIVNTLSETQKTEYILYNLWTYIKSKKTEVNNLCFSVIDCKIEYLFEETIKNHIINIIKKIDLDQKEKNCLISEMALTDLTFAIIYCNKYKYIEEDKYSYKSLIDYINNEIENIIKNINYSKHNENSLKYFSNYLNKNYLQIKTNILKNNISLIEKELKNKEQELENNKHKLNKLENNFAAYYKYEIRDLKLIINNSLESINKDTEYKNLITASTFNLQKNIEIAKDILKTNINNIKEEK
jgi:hypothetical protein